MLEEGIYLACSAYETGFISTQTTDEMIEETILAAKSVLAEIAAE
jgi:glutamate-1-semialdehyde 2,1-aminomutase